MRRELNELEIKEIKDHAREKLGNCRKTNDIIGSQIFSIPEKNRLRETLENSVVQSGLH